MHTARGGVGACSWASGRMQAAPALCDPFPYSPFATYAHAHVHALCKACAMVIVVGVSLATKTGASPDAMRKRVACLARGLARLRLTNMRRGSGANDKKQNSWVRSLTLAMVRAKTIQNIEHNGNRTTMQNQDKTRVRRQDTSLAKQIKINGGATCADFHGDCKTALWRCNSESNVLRVA